MNKFKIWDKVRCIWSCRNSWVDDGQFTIWEVYKILKHDWDDNLEITWDSGIIWRVNGANFELVQEDKLPHELQERDRCVNKKPSQNKQLSYTYQTQILRSDWLLFTKDKIGDELVSDIQARMNRDRSLLRAHKNLFK